MYEKNRRTQFHFSSAAWYNNLVHGYSNFFGNPRLATQVARFDFLKLEQQQLIDWKKSLTPIRITEHDDARCKKMNQNSEAGHLEVVGALIKKFVY